MFGFETWLAQAEKGDGFAARISWSMLGTAIHQRRLTDEQWQLLTRLLDALNAKPTPTKLMKAANGALGLGRRPGRKAAHEVEASRFEFAEEIFNRHGEIKGRRLGHAIDDLARERWIGWSDCLANPSAYRKAYLLHLPFLLERQRLSRENDAERDSGDEDRGDSGSSSP